MAELTDELLAAIKKNLPESTAGAMKQFIEEATRDKKLLDLAQKTNEECVAKITAFQIKETLFNNANYIAEKGDAALKAAEKKESELAMTIATEQIKQRDFVINKFENFLALLVKNPRAIELTSENRNVPIYEPYIGGGGSHSTRNEFTSGHKEKIETKED